MRREYAHFVDRDEAEFHYVAPDREVIRDSLDDVWDDVFHRLDAAVGAVAAARIAQATVDAARAYIRGDTMAGMR